MPSFDLWNRGICWYRYLSDHSGSTSFAVLPVRALTMCLWQKEDPSNRYGACSLQIRNMPSLFLNAITQSIVLLLISWSGTDWASFGSFVCEVQASRVDHG